MDRITGFERRFVFRVARGYFFAMAILAVATFVGGGVLAVQSLTRRDVPAPAALRPPTPHSAISYAQVSEHIRKTEEERQRRSGGTLEQAANRSSSSAERVERTDPTAARLDEIGKRLRALFPDSSYAWADEVENVCVEPTAFGCLRRENRIKRRGIVGTINSVMRGIDSDDERMRILELLIGVLEQTPVLKRGDMIIPTIQLEISLSADDAAAKESYEGKVTDQRAQYAREVEENEAKRQRWWRWGLTGLGTGFGLLIVVSVFLALLSMERHTRALERLATNSNAS